MGPSTTSTNTTNANNMKNGSTIPKVKTMTPLTHSPKIMFSIQSYSMHNDLQDMKHNNTTNSNLPPPIMSCIYTGMTYIFLLMLSEQLGRFVFQIFDENDLLPPVLSSSSSSSSSSKPDTTNQYILVRHLFVDTLSCIICASLGWYSRHESFYPIMNGSFGNNRNISRTSYEQRLNTYMPNGFRLSLFFFAYQIKNLYDTIVWNDGPVYIFHHIFSLFTAYGAMIMTCGHVYTIFFFGISEISTAILCVLANFDDEHGIVGLGDAFPLTKVACGALFVVLFILCRCILWPIHSYYFCNDILSALRNDRASPPNQRNTQTRRNWMIFFLTSLSGLSILQILWLGQIFVLGQQELQKIGII